MKSKILLTTGIVFILSSVSFAQTGQNLYQDAITLYKWKTDPTSKNTESVGVILEKLRMNRGNNKNVSNPEIDTLNKIFLLRSFAKIIQEDPGGTNEKIMQLIEQNSGSKSKKLSNLRQIRDRIKTLKSNFFKLKHEQKILKEYTLNGANQTYVDINERAKKNCPDSLALQDSCFKAEVVKILGKEIENNQFDIDSIKRSLNRENKKFIKAIDEIGLDDEAINEINIIKKNTIKPEVEREPAYYKSLSRASIETGINEYNINIVNNSAQLTNRGMPSQSELINAFSTYLAKRVKQEAMIFFMESLRNKLDAAQSGSALVKALKKMLPETSEKLWEWNSLSTPNFDNSWKYAFSKDLISLPKNGIEYLNETPGSVSKEKEPYLDYLIDGYEISSKIIKRYNFVQLVQYFGGEEEMNELKSADIRKFMRLTYIINSEMYKLKETDSSAASNNFWISSSDFISNMRNNDGLLQIFMALLVNKYPDISGYFNDINLYSLKHGDIATLKSWMSNVLMSLQHFQESQAVLKTNDKLNYNINSYWTALSEVIDVTLMLNRDKPIINVSENAKKYIKETERVFEVYQLLQGKNFEAASRSCMTLLSSYLSPDSNSIQEASRIASFISGILQSTNSEQMADVVNSFALPPASYRLKQNYSNCITVGAYFGPYGGIEFIKGKQNAAIVGFSAPITLDFNWQIGKDVNKRKSYITASLIMFDLGAVVSYRIKRESNGLPKEVRWSQLFSPGANLRFGLGNSPLTFSLGGQMNPRLRDFDSETGYDAIRLSAGLMVDMPLLLVKKKENRYFKPKK